MSFCSHGVNYEFDHSEFVPCSLWNWRNIFIENLFGANSEITIVINFSDNTDSPKQDKSKGQRGRPRKSPTQQPPSKGQKHASPLECDDDSAEEEMPLKRVKKASLPEEISQEKEKEEMPEEDNSSQQKRKRIDSEHSDFDEESEDFDRYVISFTVPLCEH